MRRYIIANVLWNTAFVIQALSEMLGITTIHPNLPWYLKWWWLIGLAGGNLVIHALMFRAERRREVGVLIAQRLKDALDSAAEGALADMRGAGWSVGVHNDYRAGDEAMTFWLLTHPAGLYVKGEGRTDAEALAQCAEQARKFAPSP